MSIDPLADLTAQVKQRRLENDIKSIKDGIESLKRGRNCMGKLIELEIFQDVGSNRLVKKVSINPEYIVYIREDDTHAYVYMTNDSVLHTVSDRETILKLIEDNSNKSYIG